MRAISCKQLENRTPMYVYDEYDQRIIEDRVKQFRDQTRRYLAGELSEEEFRPLRLQNGLYIQRFCGHPVRGRLR